MFDYIPNVHKKLVVPLISLILAFEGFFGCAYYRVSRITTKNPIERIEPLENNLSLSEPVNISEDESSFEVQNGNSKNLTDFLDEPFILYGSDNPVFTERGLEILGSSPPPTIPRQKDLHNDDLNLMNLVHQYLRNNSTNSSGRRNLERKMVINKSQRTLGVYFDDILMKEYSISLGFNPIGDKERVHDGRTPEGIYHVSRILNRGQTNYHRALLINYPNVNDAEEGLKSGIISDNEYSRIVSSHRNRSLPPQRTNLGGLIEIHGGGINVSSLRNPNTKFNDWTSGCIALDNSNMDELYNFAMFNYGRNSSAIRLTVEIKP
jgi:hypothetical protein